MYSSSTIFYCTISRNNCDVNIRTNVFQVIPQRDVIGQRSASHIGPSLAWPVLYWPRFGVYSDNELCSLFPWWIVPGVSSPLQHMFDVRISRALWRFPDIYRSIYYGNKSRFTDGDRSHRRVTTSAWVRSSSDWLRCAVSRAQATGYFRTEHVTAVFLYQNCQRWRVCQVTLRERNPCFVQGFLGKQMFGMPWSAICLTYGVIPRKLDHTHQFLIGI